MKYFKSFLQNLQNLISILYIHNILIMISHIWSFKYSVATWGSWLILDYATVDKLPKAAQFWNIISWQSLRQKLMHYYFIKGTIPGSKNEAKMGSNREGRPLSWPLFETRTSDCSVSCCHPLRAINSYFSAGGRKNLPARLHLTWPKFTEHWLPHTCRWHVTWCQFKPHSIWHPKAVGKAQCSKWLGRGRKQGPVELCPWEASCQRSWGKQTARDPRDRTGERMWGGG